jgi:hypothetical protein
VQVREQSGDFFARQEGLARAEDLQLLGSKEELREVRSEK